MPDSPDIVHQTIDRLNQGVRPDLRGEFISAIVDLAWLEIYFYRRPEGAAPWIAALRRLLPPGHQSILRLEGWSTIDSDPGAARAKLGGIADRDPLAALGMVYLMSDTQALPATQPTTAPAAAEAASPTTAPARPIPSRAATRPAAAPAAPPAVAAGVPTTNRSDADADLLARRLLEQNPTGVTGMMIDAALRARRTAVLPRPSPHADALKSLLSRFPREWMDIITKPEAFYTLVGDPLSRSTHKLGEPMLARVKLQSLKNFDIPVGPDGVIKPDLWFDARVGAAMDRQFPMAGYDRVANILVLRAKQSSTQVIRVNPGALGAFLKSRPAASMDVLVTGMTNPVAIGDRVMPGPCGMKRVFSKKFIRAAEPVADDVAKEKIYKVLTDEKHLPSDQMLALDALTAYVGSARLKGADGRVLSLEGEFLEQIEKARNDRVPHVGAWATYQAALVAPAGEGVKLAETLAKSEYPEIRLLASLAAGSLTNTQSGKEEARRVAITLAADNDPDVQAAAKAQVKFLGGNPKIRRQFLPTTQPSTQPATQPGSESATGAPSADARR